MSATIGSLLATSYGNGSLLPQTAETDPTLAAVADTADTAKTIATQATAALDTNGDGTISTDEAKNAPTVLAQLSAESLNTILGYMGGGSGGSSTSTSPLLSALYANSGAATPTPASSGSDTSTSTSGVSVTA